MNAYPNPALPVNSATLGRPRRAVVAHNKEVEAQVSMGMTTLHARGMLADQEMMVNAAVMTSAANTEMLAAEQMIQRAGVSQVAQSIAASRINRLIQANEKTLSRHGF